MTEIEIADPTIGIVVVALGALLVLAGIGIAVLLLSERSWWERSIMGMLSMEMPDMGLGGFQPILQQVMQSMTARVFLIMRFSALMGGGGLSVIGVVLILLGFGIWF